MTYPPTALLELYASQARAGTDVVTSWMNWPGDPARLALDVNDLIANLLDAPKRLEKQYFATWKRLGLGLVAWCIPAGEAMFRYWDSLTEYLTAILDLTRRLVAAGHAIPLLPDLEEIVSKLNGGRQRAYDGWPWFRPEDAKEALDEHARGESLTLEEVFGALSSTGQ